MSFLSKLNPLRLFGKFFEGRPWLRRGLWIVGILIVLTLVSPALGSLEKITNLFTSVFGPLLDNAIGRAVLVVLLGILIALVVYAFAKERVRDVGRRYALSLHLRGIEALALGNRADAHKFFRRVVRLGRWIDLGKGESAAHGSLRDDARIKLARLQLERGLARRALAELGRVPAKALPKKLGRSFAELRARAIREHPEQLDASVVQVLGESHATWPVHEGIALDYAAALERNGDLEEAISAIERCKKKNDSAALKGKLAQLFRNQSQAHLLAGDLKQANKAIERSLREDDQEESRLIQVDVLLARGELEHALGKLRELGTPAAQTRLRELLAQHADVLEPRQLLGKVPRRASLLTLAEHWLEQGEARRAERALRIYLRDGRANPRVVALLASLAAHTGQARAADDFVERLGGPSPDFA